MIPIKIPKEQKANLISNVQKYFAEDRSEEISDLGAELIIDFMIKELSPYIYNKAIADVRQLMNEKMSQIDDELYSLEKPINNLRR